MAPSRHFVVTCEHGGNRVPPRYQSLFSGHDALLRTHLGYDAGAIAMARQLAQALPAALFVSSVTRLLVDLNRSAGHHQLYSPIVREASLALRREIFNRYYLPYRTKVEADIAEAVSQGKRVFHISSHSFTPELDGEVRNADIGLLYDPARSLEMELCRAWQLAFGELAPPLRVRRNYPYTGSSDGFTAYLRGIFPAEAYIGIELEINQKHYFEGGWHWRVVRRWVTDALLQALAE